MLSRILFDYARLAVLLSFLSIASGCHQEVPRTTHSLNSAVNQKEEPFDLAKFRPGEILSLPQPSYRAPWTLWDFLSNSSKTGIDQKDFSEWTVIDNGESSLVPISDELAKKLATELVIFDCTPFYWDQKLISALKKSSELRFLRVSPRIQAKDFEWLVQMETLRGLSINNADLSDVRLRNLSKLRELRLLDLGESKKSSSATRWLPDLPKLEVLNVDDYFYSTSSDDDHLPAAGQFPKLKAVFASNIDSSDDTLAKFTETHPDLQLLWLPGAKLLSVNAAEHIAKLKNLKELHIGQTKMDELLYDPKLNGVPFLQLRLPECRILVGS